MTQRSRPPTDQQRTGIYDPEQERRERTAVVEIGTPTEVTPQDRSEPIRVISLKAPTQATTEAPEERPAKQHQARLRRLSEVSPQRHRAATPPGGLGYLAPPRDPRQARTRRWRDYVMWGSVAVILAGAVTLGVWFLARA
jgi:hypothetical protein